MTCALAALLLSVAVPSLAADAEKQPTQDSGQIVALDSAIRQMGETLPQATDQTIEVLKKQGGPVVLMYYKGALRRRIAIAWTLGGVAALLTVISAGLILSAMRTWAGWEKKVDLGFRSSIRPTECAVLVYIALVVFVIALFFAGEAAYNAVNAEFYALRDCIGQAALLLGR